jgi:hypothetical protein
LIEARNQLSSTSPQSSKYQSIQERYNNLLLEADDARKELGSDRQALIDLRTGGRVDKIDSPNVMDLTVQIQDEMKKMTYEDNIKDLYIRAGLLDNEHKAYGRNTKYGIEIPLTRTGKTDQLVHGQAIEFLTKLGYQSSPVLDEQGNKTDRISFGDVSLSDISNQYVRQAVVRTNEELSEEAERWHDRNVDLNVKRISARNMALLNIDPGKLEKEQFSAFGIDFYPTRMLEVIGETVLPKGMTEEIGISDVKLVENAIAQLEENGIELTEAQKENAERSFGLEVQEGVASFVPVMVELAVLNKAAGSLKVVTGLSKILETYRAGNKFKRGTAIAIEALIEEGQMQIAGMNTGAGASFSVMGNRLRKYGLDKFPYRFKGELARLNKFGDSVWSNSMTGAVTMEFASNVEAAIEDFMGGETMQNHLEQNYSDVSEVGKRALVNAFVFNIIGAKGLLLGKGSTGFSIRRMEEGSAELRRKGHTAEAEQLDSYIREYYETGGGFEKQMTREELIEYRNEASKMGYREDLQSLQEWVQENPEKHKKIVKGKADVYFRYTLGEKLRPYFPKILKKAEGKLLTDPTVVDRIQKPYTRIELKEGPAKEGPAKETVSEVILLGPGGEKIDSYEAESKEEAEAVSNEINSVMAEKESPTTEAKPEAPKDKAVEEAEAEIEAYTEEQFSNLRSELTLENKTKFNEVVLQAARGERINENDINEAVSEAYDALEALEGETGSEAEITRELIEDEIQKLENYELTTETETRKIAEAKTVRVPKKVERKTVPAREKNFVGQDAVFSDNKGGGGRGSVIVQEGTDGRDYYVVESKGVESDQAFKGKIVLGRTDMVFKQAEVNLDKDGNAVSVTFPMSEGRQVTVKSPEIAEEFQLEQ